MSAVEQKLIEGKIEPSDKGTDLDAIAPGETDSSSRVL
jgi:hypothetical protein